MSFPSAFNCPLGQEKERERYTRNKWGPGLFSTKRETKNFLPEREKKGFTFSVRLTRRQKVRKKNGRAEMRAKKKKRRRRLNQVNDLRGQRRKKERKKGRKRSNASFTGGSLFELSYDCQDI